MTKDYFHVRIAGRCRLSVRPEDKRKVFGAFPWMKNYFGSAEADDLRRRLPAEAPACAAGAAGRSAQAGQWCRMLGYFPKIRKDRLDHPLNQTKVVRYTPYSGRERHP